MARICVVTGIPPVALSESGDVVGTPVFGSVVSGFPSPSSSKSHTPTNPSLSKSMSAVVTAATAPVL